MNKDCLESDLDFVDYSDHVSSGLSTTRPISGPRRRVMSPPVDEVSSDFRPPLLPPVAGPPLSHSAGPLPRRRDTSHSALESAQYHNHPAAYSLRDRLYDNDGLEEEYTEEPGLSGDNSVAHGPVRSPFWAIGPWEEDWRRQEETPSRPVTARQRSFDEREKRKQLEKEEEKLRTEAEGGDYGTDETDGEEEERKGQEEEETGKREEHGAKRKQADDTRQGFQDWDSSGSYSQQRNSILSSVV